jgi:hypothetical protein
MAHRDAVVSRAEGVFPKAYELTLDGVIDLHEHADEHGLGELALGGDPVDAWPGSQSCARLRSAP